MLLTQILKAKRLPAGSVAGGQGFADVWTDVSLSQLCSVLKPWNSKDLILFY